MAQAAMLEVDRTSSARIERMNDAWGGIVLGSRDANAIAVLHVELESVKRHASGRSGVQELCEKLDELTQLAHRRTYDVPEEVFLTVSMGIELLSFVAVNPEGGADLAGFLVELDAVLRDARLLPDPAERMDRAPPTSSNRTPAPPSATAPTESADRLSRATRLRFARAATAVYLEGVRATGPSALRLRDSWLALRRELGELGRVSLRSYLLPLLNDVQQREEVRRKNVQLTADVDDERLSTEIAHALATTTLRLVERAIADGIEPPPERARLGKPARATVRVEARVLDGRVKAYVEDDGAGFEVDLAAVRAAFAREEGAMRLQTVPGRGTRASLSIPTSTTINVRTFRSPSSNALLAVDSTWSVGVATGGAIRLDVIGALGLRSRHDAAAARSVMFARGTSAFEVEVRAVPTLNVASLLFPPDRDSATEVVLVGDTEAILLRPDLLVRGQSQSTVPPPTIVFQTQDAETNPYRDHQPTLRPQGDTRD